VKQYRIGGKFSLISIGLNASIQWKDHPAYRKNLLQQSSMFSVHNSGKAHRLTDLDLAIGGLVTSPLTSSPSPAVRVHCVQVQVPV